MSEETEGRSGRSVQSQSRWSISPLQAALGLISIVSAVLAVVLTDQRELLIAVVSVCLLLISFDYAMRNQPPSNRDVVVAARRDLVDSIKRELRLDDNGWYTLTETGNVRCWYPSAAQDDTAPPNPLAAETFQDHESAGVAVPTVGWKIIEQTTGSLPQTQTPQAIEEALELCRQRELVSEWDIEERRAEAASTTIDIRLKEPRAKQTSADGAIVVSLLGAAVAAMVERPVQARLADSDGPGRVVVLQILSRER
jgi:hypothetical protein